MTDGPPPDLPGRPPLPGVPDPREPDWLVVDGLFVATRSGLLRRGYCCGAGCRFCPWKSAAHLRLWGDADGRATPAGSGDTGAMADPHHCPFCELIFANVPELQAHIASDHPEREVPDREY